MICFIFTWVLLLTATIMLAASNRRLAQSAKDWKDIATMRATQVCGKDIVIGELKAGRDAQAKQHSEEMHAKDSRYATFRKKVENAAKDLAELASGG